MTTLFAGAHVAAAATPDGVAAAPAAPAPPPAPAPAQLAAAITPAVANTHTVVSGDTLSGISQSAYGTASQWPNIYNANRPLIGADPNMIVPGQVLTVPSGAGLTASVTPAPDPAPAPVHYSAPAPAPVHHAAPASAPVHSSAGGSWSWPWSCIAQYESGGNPAANTGNGYYGGLQFSLSTWRAYGGVGNPANASIAEQEAVANRVLAGQGWGAWPNTSRRCGL